MTISAPIAANDNFRTFYVYQHRRNDTGEVFYIGKGCPSTSDRSTSKKGRSQHWRSIVNKYGYTVEIVCDRLDERTAFELEVWLIAFHGRKDTVGGPLVNKSDGGDGQSGRVPTAEHKAKLSAAHIGLQAGSRHPMFGKKHSQASNAKRSASLKGRPKPEGFAEKASIRLSGVNNPMYGHVDTPETTARRRLGKSMQPQRSGKYKGVSLHKQTGLYRARINIDGRETHLGRFNTEEAAALAYDTAAMKFFGEGTYLNLSSHQPIEMTGT